MEQLKKVLKKTIEKSGFKNAILQENAVSAWSDVVGKTFRKYQKPPVLIKVFFLLK